MTTYELPDPDWYLDNVLVHVESDSAGSGRPDVAPAGATGEWAAWWAGRAARLRQLGDPAVELALTQGFVVGTDQLAALGWERHRLRREVRRGAWASVGRGVASPVVLSSPAADDPQRFDARRRRHALTATAAVLSRRDQVISGRSAALVHGLPVLSPPTLPELTTRSPATLGRRRRAHVHGAGLTPADESAWFGAPCTSVARTVVDLARHDRRDGLMAADAALRGALLEPRSLASALERGAGWPGIKQARAVLALADGRAESPLETLLRLAAHDSGFPSPEPQFVIVDRARGRSYRVDFCWPHQRLVVEADGRVKYRGDAGWREKERETRLRALGYRVERVVWDDVVRHWPETRDRLWRELHRLSPA